MGPPMSSAGRPMNDVLYLAWRYAWLTAEQAVADAGAGSPQMTQIDTDGGERDD